MLSWFGAINSGIYVGLSSWKRLEEEKPALAEFGAARLDGKVAIVTGASSGLGLELVKQLGARGDKIFATCRKRESSATGIDQISKTDAIITQSSMPTVSVSAPKLAKAQNSPNAGIPNAALKPAQQGRFM